MDFEKAILAELDPSIDFEEYDPDSVRGAFEAWIYDLVWERSPEFAEPTPDDLDDYIEEAVNLSQKAIADWQKRVSEEMDAIAADETLSEDRKFTLFSEKIADLYDELEEYDYAVPLADAMLLGELMGRYELTAPTDFFDPHQPRDNKGRFAKKSGAIAVTPKPARPTQEELVEKFYRDRIDYYKQDGSYKMMVLGEGGTYDQIAAAKGEDAAEEAFDKYIRKLANSAAKMELTKMKIADEKEAIAASGNKKLQTELAAFERFRPDLRYQKTLADYKLDNPDEAKTLVSRYNEELRLDKVLSYEETMKRGERLTDGLSDRLTKAANETQRLEAMQDFRDSLLANGLDKKKAADLVDAVKFEDSIDYDGGYTRQVTARSATEFYQLTGESTKTLSRFVVSKPRAHANKYDRLVNVGHYTDPPTVFHEMGHHLEFADERIAKTVAEWRDRRAIGETKSLNEIVGGDYYEYDEVAKPDAYISPYVGKVYRDGSTEVISVGIQYFTNAEDMLELYQTDKSHFDLIMGVIKRDA